VLKFIDREDGEHEEKILRKLQHPGVINLIETLAVKDQIVLVFPFIEDKKHLLPGNVPLIRACIAQLLKILAFVHSRGVVHADVKPDNILFDGTNLILIDFSHAMLIEDIDDLEVGTGSYSAPELHLAMTNEFTVKVDVWSVAVILHEWINGKRLFQGDAARCMDKIEQFLDSIDRHGVQLDDIGVDLADVSSLLGEMFQKRAKNRPTATQCLKRRWFTCSTVEEPAKFVAAESDTSAHDAERKRRSSITEMTAASDSESAESDSAGPRAFDAELTPTTPAYCVTFRRRRKFNRSISCCKCWTLNSWRN